MRRLSKALLLFPLAWHLGLAPLAAQQVLKPSSSVSRAEDAGRFAHTNTRILLQPGGGLGMNGGMNPAQLRSFYGLPPTGGQGVIAIVDAYDYPVALADFNVFAAQYGLPLEPSSNPLAAGNAVFQVVYAAGTQPAQDTGWNQEEALDIEWAHALAPLAKIVLVEAASNSFSDLFHAVAVAAALPGVQQISMSWGSSEFSGESYYDSAFNISGPAFFASTGDHDFVSYPACSPYVVGVGGTSVATSAGGAWTGESVWTSGGGGPSLYEAKPSWQSGVTMSGTTRGIPDISADADPNTGVSIYDSVLSSGYVGWMVFGGTSVSSPCMAAMVNVTGGTFASTTQLLTSIYANAKDAPYPFRDITTGSATYPATVGWDYATGVGAPQGGGSFGPLAAAIPVPGSSVTVPSGATVAFTGSGADLSPSATLTYAWTFGDGGTGTGSSPSHVFNNPSSTTAVTYPVILRVTDSNGATAANACLVTVNPYTIQATITLPASSPTIASGASVTFAGTATDSASGTTLTYAWNFGDGSTAPGATATHAFVNPGSTQAAFTVTLTATDSLGGSNKTTLAVKVNPNVVTSAITLPATDPTVASGGSVNFTGTGTDSYAGATLSYAWNFGDTGTAAGATASHAFYNVTGSNVTYPVTLKVTDSSTVSATSSIRSVTVTPANTLTAAITTPATNVTVVGGTSVSFAGTGTDSAGGATILYGWAFGDGATATGAAASHVFNNPGTTTLLRTVTLTTSDATGGSGQATRTVTLNPNTLTCAITAPAPSTTVASGTAVALAATATDSAAATVTFAWTFGDGASGVGATPTHTFVNLTPTTAVYTLTLTATDSSGVTATATRTLSVTPANTLTAVITAPSGNVTVANGTVVTFAGTGTDSSGTATILYGWTFGDGTSGSGASTSHAFNNPGSTAATYTVTFTTSDATGASASATRSVTVNPNTLTAAITAPTAGTSVASGTPVAMAGTFTDSSSTATVALAWTFGDGATGSGAAPTHTFFNITHATVAYTLTLTATDNTGVTASTTRTLSVTPETLTASITAPGPSSTQTAGVPVTFTATASDSVAASTLTYAWTFGDGATGTGAATSHTFQNGGTTNLTRTVTLVVTDTAGVTATASQTLTVTPDLITAAITAPAANASAANGVPVTFSATATDSLATATFSYAWAFGDGATGSGANTTHTYATGAAATPYTATLTVTDNNGVTATSACTVTVAPDKVTAAIPVPGASATAANGVPVAFTASATDTYAGASLKYVWNFGDGTAPTNPSATATASHTYATGATATACTVTLTVTDSTGVSTTATCAVTVAPDTVTPSIPQPAADLTVPSGSVLSFTGTATDSYAAATLAYAWTFGDGATASGPSASHTFTNLTKASVVFPVTLTVTDSTGVQTQTVRSVTVDGVVLAGSSGPVGLLTGSTAVFSATVTGATNAGVIWTTSAGGSLTPSANGTTATFSAPKAGVYTVTVTSIFDPADVNTITVNVHDPDLLGSGTTVTGMDVLSVVGSMGTSTVAFDLNGDGTVNGADLAILLPLLGW